MAELTEKRRGFLTEADAENLSGRLLALDLGAKRVGVAVCDGLRVTVRPLAAIERRSWKDLLRRVSKLVQSYEATGLIIGLPSRLDGAEGSAAKEVRGIAEKFQRSLDVPVYLQNESLTTFEAESHLKTAGRSKGDIDRQIDSEAAAIILRDFINEQQP